MNYILDLKNSLKYHKHACYYILNTCQAKHVSTNTLVFEGNMPGVTVVLYMYMSTTTMYV